MRSAAAAVAWELRHRHRWGLLAVIAYLFAITAIRRNTVGPGEQFTFDSAESFALAVVVPLAATFVYFLSIFSFGLDGDIAARESMYPRRMFTLPVTAGTLAGLPMLYGTIAVALLWFATRMLAIWPGADLPWLWPGLMAASLLAWTQALAWMSYPLPGLRIAAMVLWLASIDAIVMIALEFRAHELAILAILAPHVPLAFLTARRAVARARRGEVPDWRREGSTRSARSQRAPFSSPGRAQAWFEWRRHGRSLPALVAILLPFALSMLFIFRETPVIVFETLTGVLMAPPFMGAFVAATVSKSTAHNATRPLTNASLVAAKLKVTIWSTLAAWLLVIAAIPPALRFSGTLPMVMGWRDEVVAIFGTPRAIALVLLLFLILLASTWKQLVQGLFIGMTGREWLAKASVFGALTILGVGLPLGHYVLARRANRIILWNAIPWIVAVLVLLKISLAIWVAMRLHERGLLPLRTIVIGAITWDAVVFALYGVLAWIFPELIVRHYFLALLAILEIPLVRVAAAPLALAWDRHR